MFTKKLLGVNKSAKGDFSADWTKGVGGENRIIGRVEKKKSGHEGTEKQTHRGR